MTEPQTPRPWVIWLPLALFGLFAGIGLYALMAPTDREIRSTLVGKPLPEFQLPAALVGRPGLSTADMAKGEPRLLNIFASWCVPCAGEAPQLEALKAKGVKIDAIAIRDKPEDITAFLAKYGDPFAAIASDLASQVLLALGSSGVPETFVVDGKGIIRYQHMGPIAPEHIPTIMAELDKAR